MYPHRNFPSSPGNKKNLPDTVRVNFLAKPENPSEDVVAPDAVKMNMVILRDFIDKGDIDVEGSENFKYVDPDNLKRSLDAIKSRYEARLAQKDIHRSVGSVLPEFVSSKGTPEANMETDLTKLAQDVYAINQIGEIIVTVMENPISDEKLASDIIANILRLRAPVVYNNYSLRNPSTIDFLKSVVKQILAGRTQLSKDEVMFVSNRIYSSLVVSYRTQTLSSGRRESPMDKGAKTVRLRK